MKSMMIIVTGAPAAGKTTLSRNLAERFHLPAINKDDIKELLFDSLGIKDKEWALKLGMTSFQLLFMFVEKMMQTGRPFIVEGNFDNNHSTKHFMELKSRYNCKVVQLFCHAQDEVLYERYAVRDSSGKRHPGHLRMSEGFEEYEKMMENKNFKLDIDGSVNLDMDTTNFENVDFQKIYDEVEKLLAEGEAGFVLK